MNATTFALPIPADLLRPENKWTLEQFRAIPEGPPFYELEDGVLLEMPKSNTLLHQKTLMELLFEVMNHLEAHSAGNMYMKVEVDLSDTTVYVPDFCVVKTENRSVTTNEQSVVGIPDLVIEILSESTRNRDKEEKYQIYEQFGVPFYWIADPIDSFIFEYKNTNDGFIATQVVGFDEPFEPEIFPGLTFDLTEVKRDLHRIRGRQSE